MAQMWKSQTGYVKLRDMDNSHLANAWAIILRKMHDNSMLPESLVKATQRDYYDDELLQDLSNNFRDEWSYRFESGVPSPNQRTVATKPHEQSIDMHVGASCFDWD